jgi:hypothetical protein
MEILRLRMLKCFRTPEYQLSGPSLSRRMKGEYKIRPYESSFSFPSLNNGFVIDPEKQVESRK